MCLQGRFDGSWDRLIAILCILLENLCQVCEMYWQAGRCRGEAGETQGRRESGLRHAVPLESSGAPKKGVAKALLSRQGEGVEPRQGDVARLPPSQRSRSLGPPNEAVSAGPPDFECVLKSPSCHDLKATVNIYL